MSDETPLTPCSHEGCPATHRNHKWGRHAAQTDGWFLQWNGDDWCPEHIPAWVPAWRARKAEKEKP